jgi:hypothetical protein
MKFFLRLYSVFFILIIVFALYSCAPKGRALVPDTKHYVVLLVDVEKIKPNSQGRDFCSFPDQYRYPNDSIENYTTDVLPGDTVVWIGVSTSDPIGDTIKINMIKHFSGDSVLGPLKGINGKVEAIIQVNAKPNQKEKYVIQFKVDKEGIPPKTYKIDPKILVH